MICSITSTGRLGFWTTRRRAFHGLKLNPCQNHTREQSLQDSLWAEQRKSVVEVIFEREETHLFAFDKSYSEGLLYYHLGFLLRSRRMPVLHLWWLRDQHLSNSQLFKKRSYREDIKHDSSQMENKVWLETITETSCAYEFRNLLRKLFAITSGPHEEVLVCSCTMTDIPTWIRGYRGRCSSDSSLGNDGVCIP